MSNEDELFDPPIKVTLKGDGSAPWITVDGDEADLLERLESVRNSGLLQAVAETSALFTGAVAATNGFGAAGGQPAVSGPPSPGSQQGATAGPPSTPQSAYNPAQYQVPPTPQQQAAVPSFNGAPHPEGLHCTACGAAVIGKQTRTGKKLWSCPNQRAKGDGHYTKWLDD